MTAPILIPCLVQLRSEFNAIAPGRSKASDGWIGDTRHQEEVSDHNPDETGSVPIHDADKINEVHAIDVDSDLRTPGLTMEDVIQLQLKRCRSGEERRLRYIIYWRRIWQAKNGWVQEEYHGASPHEEHAHFSASYESALEASTLSWRLVDAVPGKRNMPMLNIGNVNMPLVGEGDDDSKINGPMVIRRIQLMREIKGDGVWGPQTTKAVGAKRMTVELYRSIFGLQ